MILQSKKMTMSERIKKTRLFRFDQMAIEVKDKVEPKDADVDRYVGLEHIDPYSLKIRRWGKTSDVASVKILFKSGDIIFGKRRAYQRKLAVADFDGICSAHAMVLRPKTEAVLEDFLPFFMQSDIFMDRAVEISVGGLSPTINWKDLAKQEFFLPPLGEQRRIAKVLQANELLIQSFTKAIESTEILRIRKSINLCLRNTSVFEDSILSALLFSKSGMWGKDQGQEEEDVIVLRSTDLNRHGELDMQGGTVRSIPRLNLEQLSLSRHDLLLEKSGGGPDQPVGRIGFVESIPDEKKSFVCGNFMQLLRVDSAKADPDWFFWLMHGMHAAKWTLRHQTQTTGIRNLQIKDYLSEVVRFPPLREQKIQARKIRQVEKSRRDLLKRKHAANAVKNKILLKALSNEDIR